MKRFTALLLSLLMLSSVLASCSSETKTNTENTSSAETSAADTEAAAAESTRVKLDVPEKNYDGYEFRFLEYNQDAPGTWFQYLNFGWSSDAAGELINDAVMQRNMKIEEKYNITIKSSQNADPAAESRKLILAGGDDYDVYSGYINTMLQTAQEGLLIDFNEIPYITLENDWWDQPANRDLSIGGKMYAGIGDIIMSDEELNYCVFFNKAVAREAGTENEYQLARDGKWTIDTMTVNAKDVTRDLNGDGNLDENDAFGVLSDKGLSWLFFYACGGRISVINSQGKPEIVLGEQANIERVEKITEFFADPALVLNASQCTNSWTTLDKLLVEDRALYRPGSIYDIQLYRDMVNDFGILPYPKYNEAQDEYYHPIATQVCMAIFVPVTNSDLERTGIILESMAYESRDTVTKAYYDINLYTKVSRDEESGEMFDIIFATKSYDLAKVFDWGSLQSVIVDAVNGGSFTSLYAAAETAAQTALEKSYEYFAG